MASKTIATILNLKDNFSNVINKTTENTKAFQKQVQHTQNNIKSMKDNITTGFKTAVGSVLGLSGGIAAMGTVGVKSAIDLQNQMNKFRAATGMSTQETDKVKNAVKSMYVSTGQSYEDLTKMATTMHQQLGMGADDISKYGTGWVKFAKVAGQSNEETVSGIAGIRNAWNLSNNAIQPVLDKLILSNQKYGLSITDSEQSLKTLAPAFNAAGMNINQGIAYLDLFKKAGLDSSSATAAFNMALRKVKSPTELQKAISDISNTADASQRANKAVALFGKQGLTMAQALKPGTESITDIQKALDGATGATDKASDALLKGNIQAQLQKIKRTSLDLLESIGENALPTIQNVVDFIQKHMPEIQSTLKKAFSVAGNAANVLAKAIKFVTDNSNILIPLVAGLAGTLATLKVINTVRTAMDAWRKATQTMSVVQAALNLVLDANPLGLWVILIFAVITAITALVMNWNWVKTQAIAIWGAISNFIKTNFAGTASAIGEIIDGIKLIFSGIVDFVSGIFTGNWSKAWKGVKEIFSGIWNTFEGIAKVPLNLIIDGLNLIIKGFYKIGNVKLPSFLGGGTLSINIPTIPHFSLGTQYFKGGYALTDEKGGEIKQYPDGTKVIPHDVSMQMAKNSNKGVNVFVTIQGNVIGNEEYADSIGKHVKDEVISALKNS